MTKCDHGLIHAIHANALLVHQPQRTIQVSEGGIASSTVAKNVFTGDCSREATRTADDECAIEFNPAHINWLASIPVAVNHSVEHGFTNRQARNLRYWFVDEAFHHGVVLIHYIQRLFQIIQLFQARLLRFRHHSVQHLASVHIKDAELDRSAVEGGEKQLSGLRQESFGIQRANSTQEFFIGKFCECGIPFSGQGKRSRAGVAQRSGGDLRHWVKSGLSSLIFPPFRSINRPAGVTNPPPQSTRSVFDWFRRGRHIDGKNPLAKHALFDDIRRHINSGEDTLTQPIDV